LARTGGCDCGEVGRVTDWQWARRSEAKVYEYFSKIMIKSDLLGAYHQQG